MPWIIGSLRSKVVRVAEAPGDVAVAAAGLKRSPYSELIRGAVPCARPGQ